MDYRGSLTVHGAGYVGLTAAVHFARAGFAVTLYDPNPERLAAIQRGAGADEAFAYALAEARQRIAAGEIQATSDATRRWVCRAGPNPYQTTHLVAVPTERAGEPDMKILDGCVETIEASTRAFGLPTLVLVESTVTPGWLAEFLENGAIDGRAVPFHVALCPRRDWFADAERNLETLPRIIGGSTEAATAEAYGLLRHVSQTILTAPPSVVELVKPLENALLHLPVMLAHQMALAYPGVDVVEALRLAGTHWRIPNYFIGWGTGGRCVPLGPRYLSAGAQATVEEAVWDAGKRADDYFAEDLVTRIVETFAKRNKRGPSSAVVLGLGYRPDFADHGLSPAHRVIAALREQGIAPTVADSLIPANEVIRASGCALAHPPFVDDLVLLVTAHAPMRTWWRHVHGNGITVIDGQGWWETPEALTHFDRRGITYQRIGRPWAGTGE